MPDTVELVDDAAASPQLRWTPVVGEETSAFLQRVHAGSRTRVREDVVSILGRGTAPSEQAARAGLVVGYVQSGKTTSFTAAAALARDNGFALVVIVAGSSTSLLDQTRDRLREDLRLQDSFAYERWVAVASPKRASEEAGQVEAALREWLDPHIPADERATVLVTVMKQHQHLSWLADALQDISTRLDLSGLSALVIDDEADQASPNVRRAPGEESTTYGRIRRLRSLLPSHTLLEYTATPQAPLLVSLADELSPDYVVVLEAGEAYTGGRYFFQEQRQHFIRHIPADDVGQIDEQTVEPPPSLTHAFAAFVLGGAAGRLLPDSPAQRSMLVHPSQQTLPQARFVGWVKSMRDLWAELLSLDADDLDRQALIDDVLRPAHQDLATSTPDLPPLNDLVGRLPSLLRRTRVVEVNATRGRPEPVAWATGYSWVLVGGQLLDRGFTVEGLTVTYMPRSLGVGNADTVQQRARFFGYKKAYAGLCRAWLEPDVDHAFASYVQHEEAMRTELAQTAAAGQSLKQWKRVFMLDRSMKLTRASVVRLETSRVGLANKWFSQTHFDGADASITARNRRLVDAFFKSLTLADDTDDPRRPRNTQVHPYADVPLSDVLSGLLEDYTVTDDDVLPFSGVRLLMAVAADQGEQVCRVHRMAGHSPDPRRRTVGAGHSFPNLFQGPNKGTGYDGDRFVRDPDAFTVQMHRLDLVSEASPATAAGVLHRDAPALAIWVPARFQTTVTLQRT